jgi:diaminopimelate epimerase
VNRVERLAKLHPHWQTSVFVRVGNPHCVTLVADTEALPGCEQLHESPLNDALTRIAFAAGEFGEGDPCPAGVNLQWAAKVAPNRIMARVFERGEGPTASSGTSASAVASAAWLSGWVNAGLVEVVMPGGTAPVRLIEEDGQLKQVQLFGAAHLQN